MWWTFSVFFFNNTATTEIYTLSLHDALPIWAVEGADVGAGGTAPRLDRAGEQVHARARVLHPGRREERSEEHTAELQSRQYIVCRLLLEKKNITTNSVSTFSILASDMAAAVT